MDLIVESHRDETAGESDNPVSGDDPAEMGPAANAQDFVARGDRLRGSKNWEGARLMYQEALRLDPGLQPIWIQLGHAAKESGDLAAAESAYRKALEIDPEDADGHLQLAHLLKIAGKLSPALDFYTRAAALDDRLADAFAEIQALRAKLSERTPAGGQKDAGKTDGGGETGEAGPSTGNFTARELAAQGDRLRDSQNWLAAGQKYREALHLDPKLQPIWVQLGHAAKECGDYTAAETAYGKAIALNPRDADAHLQLGHLLKVAGRLPAAFDCYSRAAALDYRLADAHAELEALKGRIEGAGNPCAFDDSPGLSSGPEKDTPDKAVSVVFEVSDLAAYFQSSRLPTGIQRVQMEVIRSVIESGPQDLTCSIVCFASEAQAWVELPAHLFLRLCRSSVISGDATAPEWQSLVADLDRIRKIGRRFSFPRGSILVDLGTSWWQRNYFLNLRLAKSQYSIKYVPFVHDLIPVMTPEYCAQNLRRDFLSWIMGVLNHADFFLVNSRATLADLKTVSAKLGHTLPETGVVTLNADFRRSVDELGSRDPGRDAERILESHDLEAGRYVLCVATIEARKNHAAAFSVWLKLIKKHGVSKVPKLVCIGKDGWLNTAAYEALRASEILASRVLILNAVSDPALARLYRNCLCTLYPSSYEGWGLPVSEALCYGKVPIVSNVSSLPEAGGEFAEYFDIDSEKDLLKKTEKLMFDDGYRLKRERKIAEEFRPRPWREIADQILDRLRSWAAAPPERSVRKLPSAPGIWPVKAEAGLLHKLSTSTDAILWSGIRNSEIYRNGAGWWWPEHWGCWTKGTEPAILAFVLEGVAKSDILLYLGLKAPIAKKFACTVKGSGMRPRDINLATDREHVAVVELPAEAQADRLVAVTITTGTPVDLASLTDGADRRVVGAGVRWFYACKKDDLLSRVAIVEALSLDDFSRLTRPRPAKLDFFLHT